MVRLGSILFCGILAGVVASILSPNNSIGSGDSEQDRMVREIYRGMCPYGCGTGRPPIFKMIR